MKLGSQAHANICCGARQSKTFLSSHLFNPFPYLSRITNKKNINASRNVFFFWILAESIAESQNPKPPDYRKMDFTIFYSRQLMVQTSSGKRTIERPRVRWVKGIKDVNVERGVEGGW